jgi:hypothetical protein
LKLLAASCAESSIPYKELYILCSLTPQQAAGNALAGIQSQPTRQMAGSSTKLIMCGSIRPIKNKLYTDEKEKIFENFTRDSYSCAIDKNFYDSLR